MTPDQLLATILLIILKQTNKDSGSKIWNNIPENLKNIPKGNFKSQSPKERNYKV